MKRRQFLKAAGLGAAATAIAKPAIAQSTPTIKWRLTASWPKSLDTLFGACETLSKYVAEATDNKFQIQLFAAGEIVPALQVLDAAAKLHRRDLPHRHVLLYRQGPDLGAVLRRPVRPQQPPAECLVLRRRRHEADERVWQEIQRYCLVGGNTGAQMGGWFRKEIKTVDDLKGLKFRIGRLGRQDAAEARRGAAADRRRRDLSGAGERHDRCGRVGRPLRRREARLPQGGAVLLLSRLVGRRHRTALHDQPGKMERAAEKLSGDRRGGRGLRQR